MLSRPNQFKIAYLLFKRPQGKSSTKKVVAGLELRRKNTVLARSDGWPNELVDPSMNELDRSEGRGESRHRRKSRKIGVKPERNLRKKMVSPPPASDLAFPGAVSAGIDLGQGRSIT